MSLTRVTFVINRFDMGGYQRCVAHLLNNLDRTRYAPSVVCLTTSGAATEWVNDLDFPLVELHKPDRNDWTFPRRIAATLQELGTNIVHTHNWGTLVETCFARRRLPGVLHLHAEHGTVFAGSTATGWRRWINGRVLRVALTSCDHVVAVADDVRRRVVEASGFPAERIEVVRNGAGVPPCPDREAARREVRRSQEIPENAFVAGTIARLAPVKALHYAIEALDDDRHSERPLYLLLVGDGPERAHLEQHARDRGVADRVRFAGQQSRLGPWLAAMDAYVNTSLSEGISLSILEAMGLGVPVVATNVGGNPDCTGRDQSCGLLIPTGDVPALREALKTLADQPELRAELARNALVRYQQNYSIEIMVGRYVKIYERMESQPQRIGIWSGRRSRQFDAATDSARCCSRPLENAGS